MLHKMYEKIEFMTQFCLWHANEWFKVMRGSVMPADIAEYT